MLIASLFAFFVFIFLLATITVAIAWMAFLKQKAEENDAGETNEERTRTEDSPLFRSERLSTLSFWDSLLTRFDFVEILNTRLLQAGLDWSVGRVTLAMLFGATVTFLVLWNRAPVWAGLLASALVGFAPYGYVLRVRRKRF